MRVRVSSVLALVVLASGFGAPAMAQFQQPTDEELKMTADPKAPGAAAVYLNIQEVENGPLRFERHYARVKVLAEKGKDLATQEIPYVKGEFSISYIKARTIHPDGTIIPLAIKPEDLLVKKDDKRQIQVKVFTLPSVEVGSILEFSYEVHYEGNRSSSPFWQVQREHFVHNAHYEFYPEQPFAPGYQSPFSVGMVDEKGRSIRSLIWWSKLPDGVNIQKREVKGCLALDVSDIPPKPEEEFMPPIQSLLYRVLFYYKSASNSDDFWKDEAVEWSKEVDRFAEPSKELREVVAGLIASGDSDLVKAQKLYKAVQALDNTDYSRQKSKSELKALKFKEAKHAEDTWKQRSGNSEDIAMLFLAMTRAAGISAHAMKVVARDQGAFDLTYMTLDQLDDTVILLAIDGKGIFVDPGEKMAPFGTLHWRHSEAGGLLQSEKGAGYQVTFVQPYTANTTLRMVDLTLDSRGGVTGYIRFIFSGQAALRWRQAALLSDEAEVKKQFDRELEGLVPEGVEAHLDHFLSLNDPDANLLAMVNVKGTLGNITSKRLLLPAFFLEARGHTPFVNQKQRQESVDMHYAEQVGDHVVYHLPDGFAVEGAPSNQKLQWAGHAAYVTNTEFKPGQIVIDCTLTRAFSKAKPEEYQDLRGFYQGVATRDQRQLVLTPAPPAVVY